MAWRKSKKPRVVKMALGDILEIRVEGDVLRHRLRFTEVFTTLHEGTTATFHSLEREVGRRTEAPHVHGQ